VKTALYLSIDWSNAIGL